MRRFVAGTLLFLFVGQSSGVAMADPLRAGSIWQKLAEVENSLRLVAAAGPYSNTTVPMVRHAPVPRRPLPDYRNPRRYARLIEKPHTVATINRAAKPIDLVKLREGETRHRGAAFSLAVGQSAHPAIGVSGQRLKPNFSRIKGATLGAPLTGVLPWWTYETRTVPGVGEAMVNVANLNFLLAVNDVDIPEGGLDLAFSRVYNSESKHDASNEDASTPSVFGNRWTNNLDVHLGWSSTGPSTGTVSVYTADGARDDYSCTINVVATCTPPTGVYDILATTQLSNGIACQLQWTNKSGTSYIFDAPYPDCTSNQPGYYGRLLAIYGRNITLNLQLAYSWSPNPSNPENLSQIVVTHYPDQSQLTLTFGHIAGSNPTITELKTVLLPDNETINFHYTSGGDLDGVDKPGNNPILNEPMPTEFADGSNIVAGNLPELYDIEHPGLLEVCGPRAAITILDGYTQNPAADGACVDFDYSNAQLSDWWTRGVLNPTPQDGVLSPSPIQPGPNTGFVQWDDTTFMQTLSENCEGNLSNATYFSDVYGHNTIWCHDGSSRVFQTQVSAGSSWLDTEQDWDTNNNVIDITDARGHKTRLGYDANGNMVEVVEPQMSTSQGTLNPTAFFDFDSHNNLTYYCDPVNNGANNGWQTPTDSLCETLGSAHERFIFNQTDGNEQYGCLTEMDRFNKYARTLGYPGPGPCGAGLPISITGQTISQDNNRIPQESFTYNNAGNVLTYSKYPSSNASWTIQYTSDGMNRVRVRTDPDGLASDWCYNLDGSIFYSETAWQNHLDNSPSCPSRSQLIAGAAPPLYAVAYGYDPDGNVATETRLHDCTTKVCAALTPVPSWCTPKLSIAQGTMCNYYDGLERLVEVKQPQDASADVYTYPWVTRYLYDLTGSQKTFGTAQFYASGNLFKTQELLPSGYSATFTQGSSMESVNNNTYEDIKATAYDSADRATAKYSMVAGSVSTEALTWDSSPLDSNLAGLLGTDCINPSGSSICQWFDYRDDGKEKTFQSSDNSSPQRAYLYDPDGRIASITSTAYTNPQQYAYDIDGRISTATDPSGEINQSDKMSPATVTHNYYADGTLKSLDVASGQLTQLGLFAYSYRQDNLVQEESINDANVAVANPGITTLTYTYSNAGRMKVRHEGGVGKNSQGIDSVVNYDSYWRESSYQTPSATLQGFSYSTDGELLSLTGPANTSCSYAYTLRGELASSCGGGGSFANGVVLHGLGFRAGSPQLTWDTGIGVLTKITPDSRYCGSFCFNSTWGHDGAGRMNSQASPFQFQANGATYNTTTKRTYDAENHLNNTAMQGVPAFNPASNVQWGPNGHPILIGTYDSSNNPHNEVLHWDGDRLLFTNSGDSGAIDDIEVDTQGDILPKDPGYNDLTFYDRGPGGLVMGCHNATAFSYAGVSDTWMINLYHNGGITYYSPCQHNSGGEEPTSINWFGTPYTQTSTSQIGKPLGQGGTLGAPRTDGFTDGYDTLQGVRAYDSTSGSWTTPDAYAGSLNDPSSQKSYVWNSNDPLDNSDPSGYDDGGTGQTQNSTPSTNDTGCPPYCFNPATPAPASTPQPVGSQPQAAPQQPSNIQYSAGTFVFFPVGIIGEGDQAWTLFGSLRKIGQIVPRGWNWNLIKEAIEEGEQFPVANRTTLPWTSATGYISPTTGAAIMVNDADQTILQLERPVSTGWHLDNNGEIPLPGIFPALLPP